MSRTSHLFNLFLSEIINHKTFTSQWQESEIMVDELSKFRVFPFGCWEVFCTSGFSSLPACHVLMSFTYQGASLSSAGRTPSAPSILPCIMSWRRWWLAVVPWAGPLLMWKNSFPTCQSSSASSFRLGWRLQTSMRRCILSAHRSSSMLKSSLVFWTPFSRNTAQGQCRWGGREG